MTQERFQTNATFRLYNTLGQDDGQQSMRRSFAALECMYVGRHLLDLQLFTYATLEGTDRDSMPAQAARMMQRHTANRHQDKTVLRNADVVEQSGLATSTTRQLLLYGL